MMNFTTTDKKFLKLYINTIGVYRASLYVYFKIHDCDATMMKYSKKENFTIEFSSKSFYSTLEKEYRNHYINIFKIMFPKLQFEQHQELSTIKGSDFCWMYIVDNTDSKQFKEFKQFLQNYKNYIDLYLDTFYLDTLKIGTILASYEGAIKSGIRINKNDVIKELKKEIKKIKKEIKDFFKTSDFDLMKMNHCTLRDCLNFINE